MRSCFAPNVTYPLNDSITRRIYNRMHNRDMNFLGVFVGEPGIGKSGCAVSLSANIDITRNGTPRFFIACDEDGKPHPLSRVVYKLDDLLRLATQIKLPKGSMVVWDEAGVEGDSLRYFTVKARIIKYVMQTFRYRNLGICITVPDLPSILIGARRLIHWVFEVKRRRPAEGYCTVRPFRLIKDYRKGKLFTMNPRTARRVGRNTKTNKYLVPKPADYLMNPYDKIKKYMTQRWYNEFDDEVKRLKEFDKKYVRGEEGLDGKIDKTPKMSMDELHELVSSDIERYKIDGILSKEKMLLELSRQKVDASVSNVQAVYKLLK